MSAADGAGPGTFEFIADGPAYKGTPVVNGHKIYTAEGIDIRLRASELPQVTLKLTAADALKLHFADARMAVSDSTREALISMGWTPPPEAAP